MEDYLWRLIFKLYLYPYSYSYFRNSYTQGHEIQISSFVPLPL